MDYTTDTYVIFNVSELDKIDFNLVLETSAETLRKSVDETQTFVRWNGETPAFVNDLSNKQICTYDEILNILSTPTWYKTIVYTE